MFEKFIGAYRRDNDGFVSYSVGGSFSFNVRAVEKFNIKKYNFCQLYYDKQEKKIGFELLVDPTNTSYKLTPRVGSNRSVFVSGLGFVEAYNLDTSLLKRMPIEQKDGLLVCTINQQQNR